MITAMTATGPPGGSATTACSTTTFCTSCSIPNWSNFFVAWVLKLILLRYGGVKEYLAGKPFFFGLGIGYVIGVVLSTIVDMIWFPTAGHRVHWW